MTFGYWLSNSVPMENSFSPLESENSEDKRNEDEEVLNKDGEMVAESYPADKKSKPPPIFISGVQNATSITAETSKGPISFSDIYGPPERTIKQDQLTKFFKK
ncbi:hypothetical protein TKK_0002893 [Trichogramma kaykai]